MTDAPDIARVAAGLTEAQQAYLTYKAEWRRPAVWAQERWMTFPPARTHAVLMRFVLVDRSGQLLTDGLAVRQHLMETRRG